MSHICRKKRVVDVINSVSFGINEGANPRKLRPTSNVAGRRKESRQKITGKIRTERGGKSKRRWKRGGGEKTLSTAEKTESINLRSHLQPPALHLVM